MSDAFTLNAEKRDVEGKGASRRLRRLAEKVPAIIYGGKSKPQNIQIDHKDLVHHLENEAFYSHIISLVVDGKAEDVILKDLQRHPAKPVVLHADFQRVVRGQKMHVRVPLHFINEATAKGVKQGGGIVSHLLTDLEINVLPKDLPEFIEVDVADLGVGESLHISDIKLPKGVESLALAQGGDHDLPVVSIIKPRGMASEDAADEGEAATDAE
ncbi:50S ribosomal protein L25/general stress protein Ctc [Simiduia sp. 21SJ11W-1]|uniref:50S ribosomal protein L25/general stress protein Ctc n=1 Tax=Simiduia sp. 21SJ11W-1 TaxID=2909669 RepID=UPI00209D540B|nr:50S ribosomal protein L25/general stress protein Ctc [Simiduia sp. 21SJ11W-1]UTA47469.1 50S ribosomal protein L25/general stress protein Ctc [Simiduia sp. 21SJ11W-1]